jgi:hypothetical protein
MPQLHKHKNVVRHKLKPLILISFLLLAACKDNEKLSVQSTIDTTQRQLKVSTVDTTRLEGNVWVDRLTNAKYPLPDTIGGRPVSFYLKNSKVASIAKSLYTAKFRPEDNDTTTQLLSLVVTNDSTIRPFYRWCLDFTIQISDGALGEYPGEPALKYATKFPKEFFAYMDKDASGQRYKDWTGIIAYSGLPDYTKKPTLIQNQIVSKMSSNCNHCNSETKERIIRFAKDITEAIKLQE